TRVARSQPRTWRSSRSASHSADSIPASRSSSAACARSCATVMARGPVVSAGRGGIVAVRRALELLRLVVGDQAGHDLVEVAVEHFLQPVDGEPDAVVAHAGLLEVVGADLLRAVAAADLALA